MSQAQKPFKKSPKKYEPKGLSILYEDRDIIVVDKVSGLLTIGSNTDKHNTAYYLLNHYVRKGNPKSRHRIFIVHRLDRDTSGVLVFARNDKAKRFLQDTWQEFQKTYYAVVHGHMPEKQGMISSYLAENQAHRVYVVADSKKGKLAKTGYKVLRESAKYSLLEIDLLTGRKNQIRVHLADAGTPVAGDIKYGTKDKRTKRLMLHAGSLTLAHPHTKKSMTFSAETPPTFESMLRGAREKHTDAPPGRPTHRKDR
jgi:tRNA pseudouridine32 synthase/23S rRNA pseudouridine746 synthase/23S rRNA pseudouridine1911/1915/1917 synthase